jgi:putative FmdB family regulatory protein
MPLYEYVCDECSSSFEKLVRTWGEAVTCPQCQSAAVEKQLSSFAVKGAGASSPGAGCGCGRGGCGCRH